MSKTIRRKAVNPDLYWLVDRQWVEGFSCGVDVPLDETRLKASIARFHQDRGRNKQRNPGPYYRRIVEKGLRVRNKQELRKGELGFVKAKQKLHWWY